MSQTITRPDPKKAPRSGLDEDQTQSVAWSEWAAALLAVAMVVALVLIA